MTWWLPTLGGHGHRPRCSRVCRARRLLSYWPIFRCGLQNHIRTVAAARDIGIAVTNTPGAVTEATADIALMLLLMTARRRKA